MITRLQKRVALIEFSDISNIKEWRRILNRVSSLTPPHSVEFFKGVWKNINEERIKPFSDMQVWNRISDARDKFNNENNKSWDYNSHAIVATLYIDQNKAAWQRFYQLVQSRCYRDAAHTIHPLAEQGLNQGLEDVQYLLKVIKQVMNGQDIENIHWKDIWQIGVVDKLQKLFVHNQAPNVLVRSFGLKILNDLEPIKTIMKFAMLINK
ncbi:hypothetical protein C1645_740871 [Glomus cerebriforme]|uniref:Uncharacterized protein n=1 Tax=Glomus cerebriforme TaxID=658196 RepID=A0A397SUJ5_9GLOM|nr:hypothetical protein C1645_740871 [Glomus cerebriforme]